MVVCSVRINKIVVVVDCFDFDERGVKQPLKQVTVTFLVSERTCDHLHISEFKIEDLEGCSLKEGSTDEEMTNRQVEKHAGTLVVAYLKEEAGV